MENIRKKRVFKNLPTIIKFDGNGNRQALLSFLLLSVFQIYFSVWHPMITLKKEEKRIDQQHKQTVKEHKFIFHDKKDLFQGIKNFLL